MLHRLEMRTMIWMRSSKSNILTLKPPPYSLLPCVGSSIKKVQGLKSAKEICDVLKTVHEGDRVAKITKREMIKGELGRFITNKGEELEAMHNQLKTMVNQVHNIGSTK
jgi:hypothetical protein